MSVRREVAITLAVLLALLLACGQEPKSEQSTELVSVAMSGPFENAQGSYPNEPLGFRSLRWNALVGEGFRPVRKEPDSLLIWYVNDDESLRLGAIGVRQILYGFTPAGRLSAGQVFFETEQYPEVLTYLCRRFGGQYTRPGNTSLIRIWEGELTLIKLYEDKLVVVDSDFLKNYGSGFGGRPAFLDDFY